MALKDNSGSETTLPAMAFDLKTKTKLSTIAIKDQRLDLRPEISALSADGKILYFTTVSSFCREEGFFNL